MKCNTIHFKARLNHFTLTSSLETFRFTEFFVEPRSIWTQGDRLCHKGSMCVEQVLEHRVILLNTLGEIIIVINV